jgi:hypothetical protein
MIVEIDMCEKQYLVSSMHVLHNFITFSHVIHLLYNLHEMEMSKEEEDNNIFIGFNHLNT